MPIPLAKTDQLFEHLWRPGHPFRPRSGPLRRIGIPTLFILFCAIIAGYLYLTDSRRVRDLSEGYLSELVGAPVTVGRANLSVFEGLKLRDVTVHVDNQNRVDSVLFKAENIELQYDVKKMLAGEIVATRIIATSPNVRLIENVDTGTWNYQRLLHRAAEHLARRQQPSTNPAPARPPEKLPEFLLRNARVEYTELRGERLNAVGALTLEGRFWPNLDNDQCNFEMQSRGAMEGVGPVATGSFDPASGQLVARLRNFRFGRDLTTMLPAQVRAWWQQHELDGRLNIPELSYQPGAQGKPDFRVEMQLDGVKLTVRPDEWMARSELQRLARIREALATVNSLGLVVPGVNQLSDLTRTEPIRLEKAAGTFVFTDSGIEIHDVVGRLEDNGFRIAGKIDGYSPDAPAMLRISSLVTENIHLPHAPRYVNSLPPQVREVYDMLKPEGICSLWLELKRGEAGQRPDVSGEIHVLDGTFTYKNFPYPVSGATGRILLTRDPVSGLERAELHNLRGRGIKGGPNEHARVALNGWVGPFDNRIGCDISVTADNASSETELFDAFNPETRRALKLFDPEGKGGYPQLKGRFACRILSSIGVRPDTTITSELELTDGVGSFEVFPYPLRNINGKLKIFGDHVDVDLKMSREKMNLAIGGSIAWKTQQKITTVMPNLQLSTRSLPIDEALLKALDPAQRQWLEKVGLTGLVDLEGNVLPGRNGHDMWFDLAGTIHDASAWPIDGKHVVTGMTGGFHLTPESLEIKALTASRGPAELRGDGMIHWPDGRPKMDLTATARNLQVDDSIYRLLPPIARSRWDQINPTGSIDADMAFAGTITEESASDVPAYRVTLRPRDLAIKLTAFPYRLEKLAGAVEFLPDRTTFNQLTARHGDAEFTISGGNIAAAGTGWNVSVAAKALPVEKELLDALPEGMKSTLEELKFAGKIDLDCPKVFYRPGDPNDLIDVEGKIIATDASMNPGVPFTNMDGTLSFLMLIREGKLHAGAGKVDLASLRISDRPVKALHAEIQKPAEQELLQISKLQAEMAGGELAGQIDLSYPDASATTFGLNLVLRNADIQEISRMESDRKIEGQLSASLALEGTVGEPKSRRGRGDVLAVGKQMYQIPVLLGLLEIANLALPISSPFAEGTSRYSVEGERVTIEALQLKSASMTMSGSGYLDFGTKKVLMNFSTSNPNWPKLPFVSELVQNARQELLQIRVRGTIKEPKVHAAPLHTFTTSIDEVLGDPSK